MQLLVAWHLSAIPQHAVLRIMLTRLFTMLTFLNRKIQQQINSLNFCLPKEASVYNTTPTTT